MWTNNYGCRLVWFGPLSSRSCPPTSKNQLPVTLPPSTPRAPRGRPRPGSQAKLLPHSRACLPNSTEVPTGSPQSSWHQLPDPAGSPRRSKATAWLEILHENKDSLAAVPALDLSGWTGAVEAARGQAGEHHPGKQLWVWETCPFPGFRASPSSPPTATNCWHLM